MSTVELPRDLTPLVLKGHVLDVLRTLPSDSIQCCVSSPPYWGLRAYGTPPQVWGGDAAHTHEWAKTPPRRSRSEKDATSEIERMSTGGRNYEAQGGESCTCGAWRGELGLEPTPELYVSHLADVYDEVRRVLRPDGTCWLNLGDTYHNCTPVRKTSAEAFSKEWDPSQAMSRGGRRRSAAVNGQLKEKDLVGIPWRVAFELQRRGWWLRSDIVWSKPNPMPESVTDRPTRSHEYIFLLSKSASYYYDADAERTTYSTLTMPEIGESYAGQSIKDDGYRRHRAQDPSEAKRSMIRSLEKHQGANLKSVWQIATQPYPEAHFATFPEAIPERCIRLGTSERGACEACGAPWERVIETQSVGRPVIKGDLFDDPDGIGRVVRGAQQLADYGIRPRQAVGWTPACACAAPVVPCPVLDPFAGSGTTLEVARRLGRRSIGIELNPAYVTLATKRCRADTPDIETWAEPANASTATTGAK